MSGQTLTWKKWLKEHCSSEQELNKNSLIEQHIVYYLNRLMPCMKWTGLPETVPEYWWKYTAFCNGYSYMDYGPDGKLYNFVGSLTGPPDANYFPTEFTTANPALNISKTFKIKDGVLMRNDTMLMGVIPMFRRYAELLAENEISMKENIINSRVMSLISADSDTAKKAGQEYINKLRNGELAVLGSNAFFEGIKVQPLADKATSITSLIEFEQYTKASWNNELGLNANYNMKRESLNSTEAQLNDDALLPLILDMYSWAKKAADEMNEKFGLNVTVELDGPWKTREASEIAEQEMLEISVEQAESNLEATEEIETDKAIDEPVIEEKEVEDNDE